MKLSKVLLCVLVLVFASSLIFPQSLRDAEAAANDATRRLEAALSGNISAGTGSNTPVPPAQVTQGGSQPRWVSDLHSVYSRDHFIAVVGTGVNRNEAERRALAALVAFFGQSLRSDIELASLYSEVVNRGVVSVSENNRVREQIVTAASMDKLVGAEIGNIWDNGRGTVYAVAYLEKARTISIYTDMIIINNRNINLLTTMSSTEKNTFDGYARYKFASLLAGINSDYANVISLAGGSTSSINMISANTLTLESQNIIRNISVGVNARGDQNNRVRDAFARVLSSEGLRTQGSSTPYILEININMSEAVFPNNEIVFCRFTVNANLIERATGSVLLSFSFSDREGHSTYENAQNRAYLLIERRIAEKYPDEFKGFIASLLPRRL